MKHVLVTGSAGFAGSHFVEHVLANTDWRITGLDSFRHRGDSLRVYQDPSRYTVYHCDLAAPLSDRLRYMIGPVDYIVNMASESHVDRSISDPVPFVQNNINLVLNVLEYAVRVKPIVFLQISTDEVAGPSYGNYKHKEWATPLPSNPYAASKSAQESIAISYWRTYGVPVCITRTMNMYGERQDPEKYVPMLIKRINNGETVTVHGNEKQIGSRHWLHAKNHADALLWVLKRGVQSYSGDLGPDRPDSYNVAGLKEINNLEMAQTVAGIMGKPLRYELKDHHSCRPGHDLFYGLNSEKIYSLGWIQPLEFEESLKQTIEWTLENKIWLK